MDKQLYKCTHCGHIAHTKGAPCSAPDGDGHLYTERTRLMPNYGYWRTNTHPIGGDFRRAGKLGLKIVEVLRRIEPSYKGCDLEVRLENGDTAAIDSRHTN